MSALMALRQTLTELILAVEPKAKKPKFKRARGDDALFVTDAPRWLVNPDAVKDILLANGFTVDGDRLWNITPPVFFYTKTQPHDKPDCPDNPGLWPVYTLYRLIDLHEKNYSDTHTAIMLLKSMEAGDVNSTCLSLMRIQAEKVRRKEPVDGLLLPWLSNIIKEADHSC